MSNPTPHPSGGNLQHGQPPATPPVRVSIGGLPHDPADDPTQTYPPQTYPAQGEQVQSYPTQTYPEQTYPGQSHPAGAYGGQSYSAQAYPGQEYAGQGYPAHGQPPQGYPAQGYPTQASYPAQGYPAQGYSAQGQPTSAYPGAQYPATSQPTPGQAASPYPAGYAPALANPAQAAQTQAQAGQYYAPQPGQNPDAGPTPSASSAQKLKRASSSNSTTKNLFLVGTVLLLLLVLLILIGFLILNMGKGGTSRLEQRFPGIVRPSDAWAQGAEKAWEIEGKAIAYAHGNRMVAYELDFSARYKQTMVGYDISRDEPQEIWRKGGLAFDSPAYWAGDTMYMFTPARSGEPLGLSALDANTGNLTDIDIDHSIYQDAQSHMIMFQPSHFIVCGQEVESPRSEYDSFEDMSNVEGGCAAFTYGGEERWTLNASNIPDADLYAIDVKTGTIIELDTSPIRDTSALFDRGHFVTINSEYDQEIHYVHEDGGGITMVTWNLDGEVISSQSGKELKKVSYQGLQSLIWQSSNAERAAVLTQYVENPKEVDPRFARFEGPARGDADLYLGQKKTSVREYAEGYLLASPSGEAAVIYVPHVAKIGENLGNYQHARQLVIRSTGKEVGDRASMSSQLPQPDLYIQSTSYEDGFLKQEPKITAYRPKSN